MRGRRPAFSRVSLRDALNDGILPFPNAGATLANVFITFLGLGKLVTDDDRRAVDEGRPMSLGYDALPHQLDGEHVVTSPFSQEATVIASRMVFDRVVLLVTPESAARHTQPLTDRLLARGVAGSAIKQIQLDASTQSADQQWAWFRAVLQVIDPGDDVVFDFTHGFRSVPIVLSSAIGFLQKVRPFRLRHAFYTYVTGPKDDQIGDLVDLASFYEINRWADGVNSLLRGGDASHLAEIAEDDSTTAFAGLGDPELIASLRDLTRAVKDTDMNGIATRANTALGHVRARLADPDLELPERSLLDMVVDTFGRLAVEDNNRIDGPYFRVQLALAQAMLDHELRTQAYTLMRELIGSIGILGAKSKYRNATRSSSNGRKSRRHYADTFVRMCSYAEPQWSFEGDTAKRVDELRPLWTQLQDVGVRNTLMELVAAITEVRNGLNHGWTSQSAAKATAADQSADHLSRLTTVIDTLAAHDLLDPTR